MKLKIVLFACLMVGIFAVQAKACYFGYVIPKQVVVTTVPVPAIGMVVVKDVATPFCFAEQRQARRQLRRGMRDSCNELYYGKCRRECRRAMRKCLRRPRCRPCCILELKEVPKEEQKEE